MPAFAGPNVAIIALFRPALIASSNIASFGFRTGISRDEAARSIGIAPQASVRGRFEMFSEVGFHAPYREWARLIQAGVAGRKAYA